MAQKKITNKAKASKKSQTVLKKPVKGSVTRHLEAQKGVVFTEAQLTKGLNEDLHEAWHKLRGFAADLGNQRIYASAKAIMFARRICYFYARPKKNSIEVWIFLPHKIAGLTFMQLPGKKEKFCNMFKLVHADQVEEPLTEWLREAWKLAE